jgi:Holliday junction resolvase
MAQKELIPPQHLGDGVYIHDEGYRIAIAVNHHENKVVYLEANEIQGLIDFSKRAEIIK